MKVLCYSKSQFEDIMRNKGWMDKPVNCAVISIGSPNEEDGQHWFKSQFNVFNLDVDDCNPVWFGNHEWECYDKALELYLSGEKKRSDAYFSHLYLSGNAKQYSTMIHVMDYSEAFKLVKWINWAMERFDTIYVHCSAGLSRSQAIVRYILDMYGTHIETNPNNPCMTPNQHMVMMLKRAYRNL